MKQNLLSSIQTPADMKALSSEALEQLCAELRQFIIEEVAKNGGHLGASLGVVELTVALHKVLNTPHDLLIWDVGHQAYGHKILTGRQQRFYSNRKLNGISGFPKRKESEYDTFGTGHSSTSVSAMLGMAIADRLQGVERQHVAVIGDASMQAGMAFEALNHAGIADSNVLVILNDNRMSIDPSVGALNAFLDDAAKAYEADKERIHRQLNGERSDETTNLFEDLHWSYFGPIDGHDVNLLVKVIRELTAVPGPKLLHILTTKGKGYAPAEAGDATKWHAPGLFDASTGKVLKSAPGGAPKFQDVFGETLIELASENEHIVGVTPAMPTGSGMKVFMEAFPLRAFDVGIAEQHAVTFSAGLASQHLLPFCAIYSTFLQRAYDQLIHDVAIQELKVVFCIDRAGLVGEDGATHHGAYDLAYLRCVPNLILMAPASLQELRNMLYTATSETIKGSVAIRYPRGRGFDINYKQPLRALEIGKADEVKTGDTLAFLCVGPVVHEALEAAELTEAKGYSVSVVNMRFIKPLDTTLLDELVHNHKAFITVEDGTVSGGFGSAVAEYFMEKGYQVRVHRVGIPDEVIEHGTPAELHKQCGLDAYSLAQKALQMLKETR
jgi:1-deoxy-D-xylulose-5-phosphate synthase